MQAALAPGQTQCSPNATTGEGEPSELLKKFNHLTLYLRDPRLKATAKQVEELILQQDRWIVKLVADNAQLRLCSETLVEYATQQYMSSEEPTDLGTRFQSFLNYIHGNPHLCARIQPVRDAMIQQDRWMAQLITDNEHLRKQINNDAAAHDQELSETIGEKEQLHRRVGKLERLLEQDRKQRAHQAQRIRELESQLNREVAPPAASTEERYDAHQGRRHLDFSDQYAFPRGRRSNSPVSYTSRRHISLDRDAFPPSPSHHRPNFHKQHSHRSPTRRWRSPSPRHHQNLSFSREDSRSPHRSPRSLHPDRHPTYRQRSPPPPDFRDAGRRPRERPSLDRPSLDRPSLDRPSLAPRSPAPRPRHHAASPPPRLGAHTVSRKLICTPCYKSDYSGECDGQVPCTRCAESGRHCYYTRCYNFLKDATCRYGNKCRMVHEEPGFPVR